MPEGRNSFAQRPKIGRGIPRAIARRDLPPREATTAPRRIAAVQTDTGRDESPLCTIAAGVAESTLDSEWVRRAPHAALILPPPPQFADSLPLSSLKSRSIPRVVLPVSPQAVGSLPTQVSTLPSHPLTPRVASAPVSPPSRSHTAAPASLPSRTHIAEPVMQLSRSHDLQSCEHASRPQGPSKPRTPTPARDDVLPCTLYTADAAPAPTATRCLPRTSAPHTPTTSSNTDVLHLPPRSAYPSLVAECLPNWTRHFRAITEALGHAPNARPLRRGVIFLPNTAEEFRVVKRCLMEAAAQDSAISWRCYGPATKKHVKVAIRGLPRTPATEVIEALCALGYPAEAARAIPAPHGRPSCTYCVRLAHQTKEELRYLYETTELLNMPNVSVEEWRERSRPSRFLRFPTRTPDYYTHQKRRASTASAQSPAPHFAVRRGAARSPAAAAPCDDAPSNAATPATSGLSDTTVSPTVAQAEAMRGPTTLMANSNDPTERGGALHDRQRRRRRAQRPARLEPPTMTPQSRRSFTAPIQNTDRAPSQARAVIYNERTLVDAPRATDPPDQASPSTDLKEIVRMVVEALNTVMAAYLHEKGAT